MTDAPKTVVFDFDHTLYAGDSGLHFITWLIGRNWWRILLALLLAPVFAPMIACLATRRRGLSAFVWAGTVGITAPQNGVMPALQRYFSEQSGPLRARLLPIAFNVLQQHLDAGERVVIATGAPPALAQGILGLAGYQNLPVLSTEVAPCLGGLSITRHCHYEEKMRMLHEAGYTDINAAYSDSSADLPLLKAARHPVVVNPKYSRVALFQRILPEGTPILNWGCPQRGGTLPEGDR